MLIEFIPFPVDFLVLALPCLIRRHIYFSRWRKSDLDPQYPKTNWFAASIGYQGARGGEATAVPIYKHPRYWITQIGWILVWVFPYRWLGL